MEKAANTASPARASWQPEELVGITPTKACISRIRTDLNNLRKDPLPGIYCVQDDEIVNKCHALVVGPFDTPYEGGFFYFTITCPENYPNDPPRAKLMTTGGGLVRFNPNLYANGKVCLSILGTWSGPGWVMKCGFSFVACREPVNLLVCVTGLGSVARKFATFYSVINERKSVS
jgi:ubiquitin-protein ligase